MIHEPLITENPFADPHLHWCEAGFAVADVQRLEYGPHRIALPDELRSAVPKRRSEFLAGRLCAAVALCAAGLPETVARKGRAPVWPKGCAGSITHSRDRAITVVSRHYTRLGIDCEALVGADRAATLRDAIFTEAEASLRPADMPFGTFFTLIFSAKEALYKALSAEMPKVPEFLDVTLTALTPSQLDLTLHGQSHRARYLVTKADCLTLVAE